MEDEELDYYALYGVENPDAEQDPEPETDEPEEVDSPEQEDGEEPGTEEASVEEEPDEGEDAEAPDTEALRQQHDRELEELRQQHQRQMDAYVAGLKLTNPYDGNKPITTLAEYQAYQQAHQQAQWNRIREQTGMTQQQLDELVAGLPQVQQAAQTQAEAKAARDAAEEQALRQKLQEEIAAIGKLCSDVQDKESLVKHESWPRVAQRMKDTKCGVLDAFKLENFDALQKQSAEGARRQIQRNQRGKDHLKGTVGKGKGGASVPNDVLREYRRYNPGATDAQIAAHYAKRHK